MRLAIHAPLISLALCALAPHAGAIELYNDEDTKTVLNANISGAFGWFTSEKNYIDNAESFPGRVTWQEGYAKAGFSGTTDRLGAGSLYGGLSVLSNRTWGDGDAGGNTNGTERKTAVEDAYLGWKSGDLFPSLGQDGIDFSFGKQIVTVDGFLITDDGFNPGASFNPIPGVSDGRFNRGGAYYLGQRLAFKNSAVLKVGGTEGLHGSLLWLQAHAPQSGTEIAAATLDYTTSFGSIGSTYIHGLKNDDRYVFGFRGERDGMDVYSIRGQGNAGIENADFAFEVARQKKETSTQNAWFLDAGYTFADLPWKPTLSYRHARYSQDWDYVFQGGYRRRYQGEVGVNYALSVSWNTRINDFLLQLQPTEDLTLYAMYFDYHQLSVPEGQVQNLSAREVNLFADWMVTKNFTLSPLISFYKPKHSVADGLGNQSGSASTNTYFQLIGWLSF